MTNDIRIATLERAVRSLADRQAILDCIVREARGRDRHDVVLTRSAFWDDAVDEHGPRVTAAIEYPEQANAAHARFFAATNHNLANHSCDIDGDVAHCETYVVGAMLLKNLKQTILLIGRYIDRLERRDGEWRIAVRRTIIDSALQGDAALLETPMVTGFPKPVSSPADASYQRPLDLDLPIERW